jgi:hypothetical protein
MKSEKNTHQNQTKQETNETGAGATVEVLYQRLGEKWYAFSLIDDEVYMGAITAEQIEGKNFDGNK